jgi:C_GCAxxG_C_C family probable redox protein
MLDDMERLKQLKQQGFFCSQILMIQGLELLGKENPDLVRSMQALAGGLGFSGEICGALTGGSCLLGLYAGKGTPEQAADFRMDLMVEDLVKWFKAEHGERYGSIRCEDILMSTPSFQAGPCPVLVMTTLQKVKDLLIENGFDLSGIEV